MELHLVSSFIDKNCFTFIESAMVQYPDEFLIANEILNKVDIRLQIAILLKRFEDLSEGKSPKSLLKSNEYREEGNRLFRADKKRNALAATRCYTEAILASPKNSPALALGHANRAAALAEFGYYEEAYYDCDLALKMGYPRENHDKLLIRQAFCATKLKNYSNLEDALDKLRNMQLSEPFIKQRDLFEEQSKNLAELPPKWRQDEPHDYKVQNILFHPKNGRYMTAWKDYHKDQIILTEKSFAFVPVNQTKICLNCAKEQFIPFPCYVCSKAFYCSPSCKLANEKIHNYECFGYKSGLLEAMGVGHLAVNVLIRGLPEIIDNLVNCKTPTEIWDRLRCLFKSTKKRGYYEALTAYENFHLLPPQAISVLAIGACLGAEYLFSCTKFPELFVRSYCSQSDWLIVVTALILRHNAQMIVNAQRSVNVSFLEKPYNLLALTDIWTEPRHLKKRLLHRFCEIGSSFAAFYPYFSFCNHSCEPSFHMNFNGNRIIAKARTEIRQGDEIFNTYLPDCRTLPKSERQRTLEKTYSFECNCKRCQPESNDSEFLKFHQYRCGKCENSFSPSDNNYRWWMGEHYQDKSLECPKCKAILKLDWYMRFEKLFGTENLNNVLGEIFSLFKYSEKMVYGLNDMRHQMAQLIVFSIFAFWTKNKIDEIWFKEIGLALRYWFDYVECHSGVESVIYTTVATFAIDLMAEGKCFNFDKKKIRKSLNALSDELKIVFENYIKDYIGDKFNDEVN